MRTQPEPAAVRNHFIKRTRSADSAEGRASRRRMADRLDVMAVGIEHEGRVIIRMVVRPQPRRAVVPAAGRQRRAMERVYGGAILGHDRDMQRLLELALAADPEIRLAASAE